MVWLGGGGFTLGAVFSGGGSATVGGVIGDAVGCMADGVLGGVSGDVSDSLDSLSSLLLLSAGVFWAGLRLRIHSGSLHSFGYAPELAARRDTLRVSSAICLTSANSCLSLYSWYSGCAGRVRAWSASTSW